jgi:hypothetical protein
LPTHLHLGLPSGLFPSGFPTNILYAFLYSPIRATCPAHLILLDKWTLVLVKRRIKIIINHCNTMESTTYVGKGRKWILHHWNKTSHTPLFVVILAKSKY